MKTVWQLIVIVLFGLFLVSCCTTKESSTVKEEQTKILKKSHPRQLPPGIAEISATILKFENSGNTNYCLMKIDTVYGFGASTKPLATGTEMKISVDKIVSGNNTESITKLFKPNSKHKMRIRYGGIGMGKKGEWEIISVE